MTISHSIALGAFPVTPAADIIRRYGRDSARPAVDPRVELASPSSTRASTRFRPSSPSASPSASGAWSDSSRHASGACRQDFRGRSRGHLRLSCPALRGFPHRALGGSQPHQLSLAVAHRPAVARHSSEASASARGTSRGPSSASPGPSSSLAAVSLGLDATYLPGYLLAAAAALVWASIPCSRSGCRPSRRARWEASVWYRAFCLSASTLSGRPAPGAPRRCLGTFGLAFSGPARAWPDGGAFYAWDAALKRGDPRVIGALSYLTPLLSTLNLALLGGKRLSTVAIVAMSLIVAGAIVGSFDVLKGALARGGRRS